MAFPPPPVTSPATRLKSEDLSDLRYLKVDHFPEARLRFYPRRSGKPCDSPEAKPVGFSAGCEAATAACCHSQTMRSPHRFACPPSLVTTPWRCARCGLYARPIVHSHEKTFNIEKRGLVGKVCGKFYPSQTLNKRRRCEELGDLCMKTRREITEFSFSTFALLRINYPQAISISNPYSTVLFESCSSREPISRKPMPR